MRRGQELPADLVDTVPVPGGLGRMPIQGLGDGGVHPPSRTGQQVRGERRRDQLVADPHGPHVGSPAAARSLACRPHPDREAGRDRLFDASGEVRVQAVAAAAAGETDPLAMVKRVAAVALPPLDEEKGKAIRVTGADEEIALPQEKIAKLFIHFVAKAAVDERYRALAREAYALDTKGIAALLAYKGVLCDENKDAYGLLAMIYGLSFFRVMDFLPSGERDNREIAFDYIERLLMGAGNVEREARI